MRIQTRWSAIEPIAQAACGISKLMAKNVARWAKMKHLMLWPLLPEQIFTKRIVDQPKQSLLKPYSHWGGEGYAGNSTPEWEWPHLETLSKVETLLTDETYPQIEWEG